MRIERKPCHHETDRNIILHCTNQEVKDIKFSIFHLHDIMSKDNESKASIEVTERLKALLDALDGK